MLNASNEIPLGHRSCVNILILLILWSNGFRWNDAKISWQRFWRGPPILFVPSLQRKVITVTVKASNCRNVRFLRSTNSNSLPDWDSNSGRYVTNSWRILIDISRESKTRSPRMVNTFDTDRESEVRTANFYRLCKSTTAEYQLTRDTGTERPKLVFCSLQPECPRLLLLFIMGDITQYEAALFHRRK